MDGKRFAAVRAAFDQLCEQPLANSLARITELDLDLEQRALLIDMLRSDQAEMPLPIDQPEHLILPVLASSYVGNRIGPWQIERVLGTGGMGRVFLARRHDGLYEGQVAIKFLSESSYGTLFAKERAALARLQAPGIARLIDAGTDPEGRAYLVMEYIDGVVLDVYCTQSNLSARARIQLLIDALEAIAHAHSQMVLHRDLKPSNLMVDRAGQVKVLDFGIAKLLDRDDTDFQATAARYFTLRYAAPEQISGEPIGVGTDVFALAVVLYELLSDTHPFLEQESDRPALAERILTQAPMPLSRRPQSEWLRRSLGDNALRDLDAVLLRALHRQPDQRFRSAMEFAEELQRILQDRPVLSRRPGLLALSVRQIKRHPWLSLGASLALSGLVVTTVIALQQRAEAQRERDQARHQAARAERMAGFLSDLFESAQPKHSGGQTASVAELLERGQNKLQQETADDPLLQARLTLALADTWRSLGQLDRAQAMLDALLQQNGAVATEPILAAEIYEARAKVKSFQGDWATVLSELDKADAALAGQAAPAVLNARILKQRGVALINLDRLDEAIPTLKTARDLLLPFAATESEELIGTESMIAATAFMSGNLDHARDAYQRIVDIERRGQGGRHAGLVTNLNNLAATEARLGQLDAAIDHFKEAITMAEAVFGADNREAGLPRMGLGMALRQAGNTDAAIKELAAVAAIYQAWSGLDHPDTRYANLLLAETLYLAGQKQAATAALHNALIASETPQNWNPERLCRAQWLQRELGSDMGGLPADNEALEQCRLAVAPDSALRILLDFWHAGRSADVNAFLARIDAQVSPDRTLRAALRASAPEAAAGSP